MQNVYTIATQQEYFDQVVNEPVESYGAKYQARPGMELPILMNTPQGHRMLNATWGMELPGHATPIKRIHMKRMLKERPFSMFIRQQRCAVPVNCFVVKKKEVRLVRLLKQRVFCMGGIYQMQQSNDGIKVRFALLETEPADVLLPHCDAMPICFTMDRWKEWTDAEHVGDVMHLADRASMLWYDHFKVSEEVLKEGVNDRELLTPLGSSYRQLRDRQIALNKVNVAALRANNGTKR